MARKTPKSIFPEECWSGSQESAPLLLGTAPSEASWAEQSCVSAPTEGGAVLVDCDDALLTVLFDCDDALLTMLVDCDDTLSIPDLGDTDCTSCNRAAYPPPQHPLLALGNLESWSGSRDFLQPFSSHVGSELSPVCSLRPLKPKFVGCSSGF